MNGNGIALDLTRPQWRVHRSKARFRILIAGRRFGKTRLALTEVITDLAQVPDANIAYVAPTYSMAKRLMWRPLVRTLPDELVAEKNVSDLTLATANGGRVTLFGAKNYDNLRGDGYTKIIFDELADIEREAWEEAGRPALADRKGSALFIGTPRGFGNWSYDLWSEAPGQADWERFHFTTLDGGWVDAEEVAAARAERDDRAFRQEYEATFEEYGGLVYDGYSDTESVRPMAFRHDAETWLACDFNAGLRPMAWLLIQRIEGIYFVTKEFVYTNTNTLEMCETVERFFQASKFSGRLHVTGDNAGHRRESNASKSDYMIIENAFRNRSGYERTTKQVRHIQDRVNATNTLLRPGASGRRLFIDPSLKALRRGLVRVTWKDNGSGLQETTVGEIDPTDALSYFAYNYHPVHLSETTTRHSR